MDKILSTRIDESVIKSISLLAQELHTTKKAIIEAAILSYVKEMQLSGNNIDVFEHTLGAWKRDETTEELIDKTRGEFRKSMKRHHL